MSLSQGIALNSGAFEMGYPFHSGFAGDERVDLGATAELTSRKSIPVGFNPEAPPPFEDCTFKSYPVNHGVIVIKNVSPPQRISPHTWIIASFYPTSRLLTWSISDSLFSHKI